MKKLLLVLFALLLVAGVAIITDTGSVFAQDDDETTTEPEFDPLTDNWCTNPDRWGDGRCNVEGDIWLTNWYYICGYYMARVESGEYPKGLAGQLVADGCLVPLPPPPPRVAAAGDGVPLCGDVVLNTYDAYMIFKNGIFTGSVSTLPIPLTVYLEIGFTSGDVIQHAQFPAGTGLVDVCQVP